MSAKPALTHFSQILTMLEPLYHWRNANENPYHREVIGNVVNCFVEIYQQPSCVLFLIKGSITNVITVVNRSATFANIL